MEMRMIPKTVEVDTAEKADCISCGRFISQKERKKMKDSDYIDHERRSFPIKTCADIHAAISSWGRYKGKLSFEEFKARVKRKAKAMGCSLPKSWQDEDKSKK